jgi:tetratricopeptide (TPR) repeat protein
VSATTIIGSRPLLVASVLLAGALSACDPTPRAGGRLQPLPDAAPSGSVPDDPPGAISLAQRYYDAYLAETLGRVDDAQAGYEAIVAADHTPDEGIVVARAALRLARFAAVEEKRQRALDLLGQASILGGDDAQISDGVDRLRLQLTTHGEDLGIRGPAANTSLEGVSAEATRRFRAAEALLYPYLKLGVRKFAGTFDEDLATKQGRLEVAVHAYRQVIELNEPVATAAAEFRIASLYHDAGLFMLALDAPLEYSSEYRRRQREENKRSAEHYFLLARTEYGLGLAAAPQVKSAELWHAATREGMRSTPP